MRNLLLASLLLCSACNCGTPAVGEDPDPTQDGGTGDNDGGEDGGQMVGCIDGLDSLSLSPADQTVTVGNSPQDLTFTATGSFSDGSSADVTSRLAWSALRDDDTAPGTFPSPGHFQPAVGTGGTVRIVATDTCKSAQTSVTLKLEATFNDPGSAVTDRFTGNVVTGDAAKSPELVYPSDQTRFPRNIYKVLFQWKRAGHDHFRLTFSGPNSTTVIYSDGNNLQCQASAATAGCMEADSAMWLAIAGANAGLTTTVTVDGVINGDSNVYRSAPIEIGFSKRDVKGAVFYWSTTAAGVRRASVNDLEPEAYVVGKPTGTVLPNSAGTVKCVGCHTVSRSGKKMIGYTEAGAKGEYVYDVTLQSPPTPILTTEISTAKGFGTFHPNDTRVVATVGKKLAEFDADTGSKFTDLPVAEGTNPDWSPTGTELAYSDKGGDSPAGASLNVIGYADGTWSGIRTIVAAGGKSNLFPSFSPDGEWIAYSRGKGGHGDLTAQLWLAKADGSEPPVELAVANRIVNSEETDGLHENNMPTWAPPGDLQWIAFNSVRPYGLVYPNGGTQQIWVTAIDPAKLGQKYADGGTVDPSYPAFRFAFQGLAENNHRAFWTHDVRDPPDGGVPACLGLGSVCGPSDPCCDDLECVSGGELGSTCQPPSSGACVEIGASCDQSTDTCCNGGVCDVDADGGTVCREQVIIG